MSVAPITLFKNMPAPSGASNEVTIELLGTWTLRVEASGKPGGAHVSYLPDTKDGGALVVRVLQGGVEQFALTLNQILGKAGLDQTIPNLLDIKIATPAHGIGDPKAGVTESADGTTAAAAGDIVNITVLPNAPQIIGANIRLGHMEGKVVAPPGGLECPIPVSKTANPDPVNAGQDFTWTVTVPSVPIPELACDLTNIKATDTAKVLSGTPSATISGASNGGVVSGNTVSGANTATITWANLGNFHPGDPPLVFTISGHIPATSGAGVLQNTVKVTATLGKCTGGAAGTDFVNNATVNGSATAINGAAVLGTATVNGPKVGGPAVAPARLATTGEQPWIPAVGGGLLLGAMALWRGRRRLHAVRVKQ
jgi:hypothetical protein